MICPTIVRLYDFTIVTIALCVDCPFVLYSSHSSYNRGITKGVKNIECSTDGGASDKMKLYVALVKLC